MNVECPSVSVNIVAGKQLGVSGRFAGNDMGVMVFLGGLNLAGADSFAVGLEIIVSIGEGLFESSTHQTKEGDHGQDQEEVYPHDD